MSDPLEYPPLISPLDNLEERERLFVITYVETADVQKAANKAGIKVDHSFLNVPRIKEAINFAHSVQLETHLMDRRDVLKMLETMAATGAGEYLTEQGRLDLDKIRVAGANMLDVETDQMTGQVKKIKTADPFRAIAELAKMRGWYAPEKHEVKNEMELGMSDELLALLDEPIGGEPAPVIEADAEVVEDDDEIEEFLN